MIKSQAKRRDYYPNQILSTGDDMHLDSLKIQNFRLLEDIEIKKLGHVNLIVGKNNSGKSTVLEALALLASGFEVETVKTLNKFRSVNKYVSNYQEGFSDKIFSIESLLHSKNMSKNVYIGNDFYYINFGYVIPDSKKQFLGKYGYLFSDELNGFELQVSSNNELNYFKELKFGEKKKKQYNFKLIDTNNINTEDLAQIWDDAVLTEDEDLIIKMLNVIEPTIQDFAFLTSEDRRRIPFVRLKNTKGRMPLYDMGDGIFRLLQIILKVLKARDGFLLIDEFENGLHYSVQPDVWRLVFELAKRYNIQVFATTHSWDCIESFAQVAKEREDLEGVLFRMGRSVRKSDNGKVIATEFDEDELYNLTKDKIEVR
jgi:AAA15 family ATPase/GTPase